MVPPGSPTAEGGSPGFCDFIGDTHPESPGRRPCPRGSWAGSIRVMTSLSSTKNKQRTKAGAPGQGQRRRLLLLQPPCLRASNATLWLDAREASLEVVGGLLGRMTLGRENDTHAVTRRCRQHTSCLCVSPPGKGRKRISKTASLRSAPHTAETPITLRQLLPEFRAANAQGSKPPRCHVHRLRAGCAVCRRSNNGRA